jgi:SAM-dependent methyltransferase
VDRGPEARFLKRRRDKELETGSRAHYADPAYYTEAYADRADDVDFYVKIAACSGGPVLEYGVGNGRIAIPSARAGMSVHGIDHSREMLGDLRERLIREPAEVRRRVRTRCGDMRRVRLGRRFALVVCPFNGLLHLYDRADVEQFLRRVREHMSPRGRFVFDVSMPDPQELSRDPNRPYNSPRFRYPGGPVVSYAERFDYDRVRQILFVRMEFRPVGKRQLSWATPLAHRQFQPQELEALLHYNGLAVDAMSGDFSGGPLAQDSDVIVVTCRKRRRRELLRAEVRLRF